MIKVRDASLAFNSYIKTLFKVAPGPSIFKYAASHATMCNKGVSSNVVDFYNGKSVFITGGTGFIGKALIEKLLYSCSNIDKIYVLIRETAQFDASQRLHQILENPAFSRLKKERLKDLQKIIPIVGNITAPGLGISPEDENILKEKSFVYISTAYTNADKKIIEEKVYPPPAHINDVYRALEKPDVDEDKIKKLLNGKANTYIFTKALAESFVAEEHGDVPTIIIRPSMVCPSVLEPVEGWIDNMSVPSNLLLAGATGLNHLIRGKNSNIVDFVPVDYVINLTIVAASVCQRDNEMVVYNCCTGTTNPLYLGEVFKFFNQAGLTFSPNDLPFPKVFIVNSLLVGKILTLFTQMIPAYVFDSLLLLKGHKPRIVKIQRKFIPMRDSQAYFTENNWLLKSMNVQELYMKMSGRDQHIFSFNFSNIIWSEYMPLYAKAVRKLLRRQRNLKAN